MDENRIQMAQNNAIILFNMFFFYLKYSCFLTILNLEAFGLFKKLSENVMLKNQNYQNFFPLKNPKMLGPQEAKLG